MKIVVANAPGRLANGKHLILFPSRWDYAGNAHWFSYYPYELAYTSALLKRETNHDVVMVDGNHEQLGPEAYIERLAALEPDLLITECSALTYPAMTHVVRALNVPAALAGPYGMQNPDRALEDGWAHILMGEYEHKALAWVEGTKEPKDYVNLDWLPWPEDDDISRIEYEEYSNPHQGMIQVYPTRGCPLACTFCVVPMYYGGHGASHKSHRCRNVEDVCDEIEWLADKYAEQFSGCFFNEETHNANVEWLTSFCEALIERGLSRYHYDAMCGYWTFTEELVALMARAGYAYIRVGIESLSEKVGKRIHKTMIPERLARFLGWCKEYGIEVYGTTQVGAQGSSKEADIATLEALLQLHERGLIDRWQHSISTPQPGTPFHQEVKEQGLLLTEDIEQYDGRTAVVSWPDYPALEIQKVHNLYALVTPTSKHDAHYSDQLQPAQTA